MRQLIKTPGQLGQLIAGRRKAKRLPQRIVATKLGISQNRLSAIESDPDSLSLRRLMALLHVLDLELVVQDKAEGAAKSSEW